MAAPIPDAPPVTSAVLPSSLTGRSLYCLQFLRLVYRLKLSIAKAIARESARYRVRCNAVAPGPIETPLLNAAPQLLGELGERLKQGMVNQTVMGRSGEPEEVAAAIAFLASEDASYVTGQTLNVSGGLSMW